MCVGVSWFLCCFICMGTRLCVSYDRLFHVVVNSSFRQYYMPSKLMQLGVTNRIVGNSDSKPANFDRWFWSDSKSNHGFESTIAISIVFDLKSIKQSKKPIYIEKSIYIEKFNPIRSISILFYINQILQSIYGPNLNQIVTTSKSDGWNRIKKVD